MGLSLLLVLVRGVAGVEDADVLDAAVFSDFLSSVEASASSSSHIFFDGDDDCEDKR